MTAGIVTVYAGVGAFALGIIGLAMSPEVRRTRLMLACAALLLVNFPVAIAISFAVIAIETRYTVVVHNASHKTLDHVRVAGGGCDVSFRTIAPGASAHRTMRFREDGQLEFYATSGTTNYVQVIEGYVTAGMGGYTTVRINPDGSITLIRTRNV